MSSMQRTCVGPLLFILYTNDFENSVSTFYANTYADDTSISASSENPLQLLEHLKTVRGDNGLAKTK